ncbi:unnamed protein product [Boreogadus saida]
MFLARCKNGGRAPRESLQRMERSRRATKKPKRSTGRVEEPSIPQTAPLLSVFRKLDNNSSTTNHTMSRFAQNETSEKM